MFTILSNFEVVLICFASYMNCAVVNVFIVMDFKPPTSYLFWLGVGTFCLQAQGLCIHPKDAS